MRARLVLVRGGLVAVAGVAAMACSVMTSLDGLSDGDPAGASPNGGAHGDAHVQLGDASPIAPPTSGDDGGGATGDDATTGADASDAGDVGDASADSAPAPVTGYCATLSAPVAFCDDFDDGGVLAAPWDQVTGSQGTASVTTAYAVSTPAAMQVATVGGAQWVDCAGYKTFAALTSSGPTTITASFAIRVDKVDTSQSSDAVLAAIQLYDAQNANNVWDVQLEVYYDSSKNALTTDMSEWGDPGDGGSGFYYDHYASKEITLNKWTNVTMQLTLQTPLVAQGATSGKLVLDGTTVASPSLHDSTSNPIPEILTGVTYVAPGSAGWTIRYDNVTFDVH